MDEHFENANEAFIIIMVIFGQFSFIPIEQFYVRNLNFCNAFHYLYTSKCSSQLNGVCECVVI